MLCLLFVDLINLLLHLVHDEIWNLGDVVLHEGKVLVCDLCDLIICHLHPFPRRFIEFIKDFLLVDNSLFLTSFIDVISQVKPCLQMLLDRVLLYYAIKEGFRVVFCFPNPINTLWPLLEQIINFSFHVRHCELSLLGV